MPGKVTDGATLYVTLRSYLQRLKEGERSKPKSERRDVPTLAEIAAELGVTETTISNVSTNNIKQMNLEMGGRIIALLRSKGFSMEVSDLLVYRPPDDANG